MEELNDKLSTIIIEYTKKLGYLFPINQVSYLDTNSLIERIKQCIENETRYDDNLFYLETVQKMSNYDFGKLIYLMKLTLDDNNIDYMENLKLVSKMIQKREKGKKFTFEEHLESLILSMLTNNRWGDSNIKRNKNIIKKIFYNYDKELLKKINVSKIVSQLKKIECTNNAIKQQISSIPYNISILEQLEEEHGSIEKYITTDSPIQIINNFYEGKYKLKQVGHAVTCNYLIKLGIDVGKSSKQLGILFGSTRLGIVEQEFATNKQQLVIIKRLAILNNMREVEIQSIINQFYEQICAKNVANSTICNQCRLKNICKNNFELKNFDYIV